MLAKLITATALAFDSIRAHKLRSFLTLLGIIIGVASVILVGAAIDGLGAYAEGVTATAFGTESYLVAQVAAVGRLSRRDYMEKLRRNKLIRTEDLTYLRQTTGDRVIYTFYSQRTADVKGDNQVYEAASVIGASFTLPDIRDVPITDGRFFTEAEEQMHRPVAVVGTDIRQVLFGEANPIGKKLRIGGVEFTVVGLLQKQGSAFGRNLDNPVYIPASVFVQMYGGQRGISLFGRARATTTLNFEEALDTTRAALRARFHAAPGKPDNFDTLTPDSVRSFVDQILGFIAAIVVPITSISLVVGGIVVMNIMLVSVTERTREIGVRKSLGATQRDIQLQFLTESVILSMAGGALGVALGALVAAGLSLLFGLSLRVTLTYVVLSISVSTLVGVISGWYPARRAARMDPVVALRAES
jgi:putative ABC transport system permease protein